MPGGRPQRPAGEVAKRAHGGDPGQAGYHQMQEWAGVGVDHHGLLRAAPQTFSYAWQDSPVGLLAWMIRCRGSLRS
jgi:hypothetical protein